MFERFERHGYARGLTVRISDLLAERENLVDLRPEERQERLMSAGNDLRDAFGENCLASVAIANIYAWRTQHFGDRPALGRCHLIRSLKHPEEVAKLRAVYGRGFFLIGASAPRMQRRERLIERNFPLEDAERLLGKDSAEVSRTGQQTRDTFHLADAYVRSGAGSDVAREIHRIVDLLMSHPFLPPTLDEYAMFMAYAAALRSADLSRQVGAVIVNRRGDLIATGANDAPSPRGGPYWPSATNYWPDIDHAGGPDYVRGHDSNEAERDAMLCRIIRALVPDSDADDRALLAANRDRLRDTGILDLTEFGRAVHAEMAALTACARSCVRPIGGTLYCTTFPCHNCTKHIVDAGIERVVFVEPYPKSKAKELHDDAIMLVDEGDDAVHGSGKVKFEPFVGIGPRRFVDLFSMTLGSGRPVRRKRRDAGGARIDWRPGADSAARLFLDPRSYLEREKATSQEIAANEDRHGKLPTTSIPGGPEEIP